MRRGIGHQQSLFKTQWKHAFDHGGILRAKKLGRGYRPLSSREPLHLVLKARRSLLKYKSLRAPSNAHRIHKIIKRYSLRFYVKVEQVSIQGDHIHLLVRASHRPYFHAFFRVVSGQIAQQLERVGLLERRSMTDTPGHPSLLSQNNVSRKIEEFTQGQLQGTELWKYRPFSRVVRGYRAYRVVREYIQLNELEARGRIAYRKQRLRGVSSGEWALFWV